MSTNNKKINDFNDKVKVAVITNVKPQNKTIDISYLSQGGSYQELNLPYPNVGLGWGSLHMPVKGDRVLIEDSQGGRPVVKGYQPVNTGYLPFIDSGEQVTMGEGGSYIHLKSQRKRGISSNELLDYDASAGPNGGSNDIQYEPSGITIRARSKKTRDGNVPGRYDNHSYLSLFSNGDVALQAMSMDVPRGLLFMCGSSGYVFLKAGNGSISSYLEMDPTKKQVYLHSDGETQLHSQTNHKHNIYNSLIYNIGQGFQMTLGQSLASIPSDMDQVIPSVNKGDIFISNANTAGSGKFTLHLKGDFDVISDTGNVNITATQGTVNVVSKGNINVTTQGNTLINSQGSTTINATGPMNLTSDEVVNIGGNGGVVLNGNGDIKIGSNAAADAFVLKSEYDTHFHIWNFNGPNDTTPPTVPASENGIFG